MAWEPIAASAMLGLVALLTPAPGGGSRPAGAEGHGTEVNQEVWPDDIVILARQWAIGPADAMEVALWENALGIAAERFQNEFPSTYAGIEIVSAVDKRATLSWVGTPPDTNESVLTESAKVVGLDPSELGDVELGSATYSLVAIDEGMVAIHYAIQALVPEGSYVGTRYDEERMSYVTAVGTHAGRDEQYRLAAESALLATKAEHAPTSFEIEYAPGARAVNDARNGGGYLVTDGHLCTGGFNVRSSTGVDGVATAGHCHDSPGTHKNRPSDSSSWSLTYKAGHQGQWGDFQWHTTGDAESDDFYYNTSSAARDVTGVGSPNAGQALCRFGYTTGAQCDNVSELSVCVDQYCRLVQMAHREADGGDSGGPWSLQGVAYGYHHGGKRCGIFNQNWCDDWSRASYIDDALNVFVKSL